MRGVHRDFETLAFRQSRASHRVIQLDLVSSRGSTEGAADKASERVAHGGFGLVRRQPHRERILKMLIAAHRTLNRIGHARGLGDLGDRSQLGIVAVEQPLSRWRPLIEQRSGDLDGLDGDRRADGRDGRIGVVDEVPTLRNLLRLVRRIDAVARVDSHLRHAIRRDDDRFTALEGTSQLNNALFAMQCVEVTEQLFPLPARRDPHAVDQIFAASRVERFRCDADAISARCLASQRFKLPQSHRNFDVSVEEEVQVLAM